MQNEVRVIVTLLYDKCAVVLSEIPMQTLLLCSPVSYLVIFHIFLMMFIWSYWKTIWSRPAGPSKAVRILSLNSTLFALLTGTNREIIIIIKTCTDIVLTYK